MSAETLELLLRACAAAWAFAAAIALLVRRPRTPAATLAAFCVLGVCAFIAVSTSVAFHALGVFGFALDVLCLVSPLMFWLLARVLFEDGFAPTHATVMAVALFAGVAGLADWGRSRLGLLGSAPELSQALFLALRAASFALVAHGVAIVIGGWRGDLVDARRAVRGTFALLAGGAFGATVASSFLFPDGAPPAVRVPGIALLAAAMLVLLVLVATGAVHERLRELLPQPEIAREPPRAVNPPVDAALAARVVEGMERDAWWREERLTLGALAARLEVPEYRLRRAINRHLGHRSFSAFVAQYRLEAAASALADPARERTPVVQVAFDCGFNSLGPFNRAFRARFGVTPTQFRAAARARTLADSSKAAGIGRSGETQGAL